METSNTKSPCLINGYGRFLRQKKAGKASALHEGEAAVAFDENDDPFAEAPL